MKRILAVLALCFAPVLANAGTTDRFGNNRNDVPRSSYTETQDTDVLIASCPTNALQSVWAATSTPTGALYLRRVIFSGVNVATITFYDCQNFNSSISTRAKLSYVPSTSAGGVTGLTEINLDMYFSSGIVYSKQQSGTVPMNILWDFTTAPRYRVNQY